MRFVTLPCWGGSVRLAICAQSRAREAELAQLCALCVTPEDGSRAGLLARIRRNVIAATKPGERVLIEQTPHRSV